MTNPVFILGATKSGTSLLRNMLDGHPSLFVLPTETHFFRYVLGDWVNYSRSRFGSADLQNFPVRMLSALDKMLEDSNRLGGGHFSYDREKFHEYIQNRHTGTFGEQISLYMDALHFSVTGCPLDETIRPVEKSVENAEFAFALRAMFPDCKLVHVVRNPYANVVALRKFRKTGSAYPSLAGSLMQLSQSYHDLFRNMRYLKNYMVIRFEDLVAETEDVMRRLCKNIDIEFLPCLLQPTIQGAAWQGNSTSGTAFQGLSQSPLTNWESEITSYEQYAMNILAQPVFEQFNYEMREASFPWRPNRQEAPQRYLLNRLVLKLLADRT